MRTIVFLDLDNTYWNWGKVPESALRAVRMAQANGHVVVANTSRTRGGVQGGWPSELDGICAAAGMDVSLHGEQLVLETLGCERAREVFEGIDIGRGLIMAEGTQRDYVFSRVPCLELMARHFARRGFGPDFFLGDMRTMTDDDFAQIQKFGITFPEGPKPKLIAKLRLPEGIVAAPMSFAVDVTDARFSKVTAMDVIRDRLGGTWRTVAFGDSPNDIPMLQAADVGVAMGNGKASVKTAADHVTDHIDHDGLLHAFEHLELV